MCLSHLFGALTIHAAITEFSVRNVRVAALLAHVTVRGWIASVCGRRRRRSRRGALNFDANVTLIRLNVTVAALVAHVAIGRIGTMWNEAHQWGAAPFAIDTASALSITT
jgi:hypothetical protein